MFRGVAFSPTPFIVLPVKLSSFDGYLFLNEVVLDWSTSLETGVERYVIEKSVNGSTYAAVGSVAAKNNAAGSSYQVRDKNSSGGIQYYRLKVIDLDGNTSFSRIVVIRKTGSPSGPVKLFPNPVLERLSVSYPAAAAKSVLAIADVSGRELLRKNIAVGSTQISIDVSTLSHGMYNLILYTCDAIKRATFNR